MTQVQGLWFHKSFIRGGKRVEATNAQQLKKSVSFFGLVALGLGGVWGTSWLMVSSTWLDKGGGVINALLAWVLILVLELPLVLAYRQAVPMFPKAEGEMSYNQAAFGNAAGFWAAWFGILVNLIVCAYEVVALVLMVQFLWPSVTANYWYKVMGSPVGLVTIILGLIVVLGISILHYRGVQLSSTFQNITSTTLMILVVIGVVMAISMGSFRNFQPLIGKPMWQGVIAVAAMLPFSMAGWESIAKGAEEASDSKTSGKAVPVAWFTGWLAYVLTLIATGLVMSWTQGAKLDIPFATGLNQLSGSNIPGIILIITALIGVVGVYNALFYSVTRQMYGMARQGMMPKWLAEVHPTYKTPYKTIVFSTCILIIAPFLGSKFLIPFVDAASFAYIILWGSTFLAVVALRKRYANTEKQFNRPGGIVVEILGYISILFLIVVMLYPQSPGALVWPLEHIILAALIIVGAFLYFSRQKTEKQEI
jgi:amino acid transporter